MQTSPSSNRLEPPCSLPRRPCRRFEAPAPPHGSSSWSLGNDRRTGARTRSGISRPPPQVLVQELHSTHPPQAQSTTCYSLCYSSKLSHRSASAAAIMQDFSSTVVPLQACPATRPGPSLGLRSCAPCRLRWPRPAGACGSQGPSPSAGSLAPVQRGMGRLVDWLIDCCQATHTPGFPV